MMISATIDRPRMKAESRELLRDAQVSARSMVLLYMGINLVLNLIGLLADNQSAPMELNLPSIFVSILTGLLSWVLSTGFMLYCMAIRRGERAEYLTLFDGFSFAGKIVGLYLLQYLYITLWSMLFLIPGIIAAYRYRFAMLNLCEDPSRGILEALELSKRQTMGYKWQIFLLDLSYFGWMLLASLPSAYEGYYLGIGQQMPTPAFLYVLFLGIWGAFIALFYLANYQTTEIGYFEIAKRTSGTDGSQPPIWEY